MYALKNAHKATESDIMFSYTVVGNGGQQYVTGSVLFVDWGGLIGQSRRQFQKSGSWFLSEPETL